REDGHGLREAIDRGPPVLPKQEENGADQRPGVADTNPEDEVDDGKAPSHRVRMAPGANAFPNDVAESRAEESKQTERESTCNVPGAWRSGCLHDARHVVRDLGERVVACERTVVRVSGGRCGHRWSRAPDGGFGCGPSSSHEGGC